MIYRIVITALLSILLVFPAVFSQDFNNIEFVSSVFNYWSNITGFDVADDYLYAGRNSGLVIIDLSDLYNPVLIDNDENFSAIEYLYIDGDRAYIYEWESSDRRIIILDITDRENPEVSGETEIGESVSCMTAGGDYLYVSFYQYFISGFLDVYDVSDPGEAVLLSSLETSCPAEQMEISGGYLYCAELDAGLSIYDLSDPGLPTAAGSFNTPGDARDFELADDYAIVADGSGGLWTLDITDPYNPGFVSFIDPPNPVNQIERYGDFAFIPLGYQSGLIIYDISDPANIVEYGVYEGGYFYDFAVAGNLIYENQGNSGFEFHEIISIDEIELVSEINNYGSIEDAAVCGDYLYAAAANVGLYVIDVFDPGNPQVLSVADSLSSVTSLVVEGDYLYYNGMYDYIHIADISDPPNPVEISEIEVSFENYDGVMIVIGDYLYCLSDFRSIYILDVSDKENPFVADSIEVEEYIDDFSCDGSLLAYCEITSLGGRIIQITDISDPLNAVVLGQYACADNIVDMHLDGNRLYFSCGDQSINVLDLSDPANPELAAVHIGTDHPLKLRTEGDYLYVSQDSYGVTVLNAADTDNIYQTGYYDPGMYILDLDVRDNYIFTVEQFRIGVYDCAAALPVEEFPVELMPEESYLSMLSPNPFNARLGIEMYVAKAGDVRLAVYDIQGREVQSLVNGHLSFGKHEAVWDAEGFASGVYLVRMMADGGQQTAVRKAVLVK